MKTIMRSIDELRPYENNPRKNNDAVAGVAESIKQFGFLQPIVVDTEGVIVVGHTRYKAALQLGLKQVPVVTAEKLNSEQLTAYRLLDNRLNEIAEWDNDLLQAELALLENFSFENFNVDFDFASDDDEELTDTELPPIASEIVTRPGDLWILGRHRLVCGDATLEETFNRSCILRPVLMVTDPPYGVNYDASWRNNVGIGKAPRATGKVSNDDIVDWTHVFQLWSAQVAYVWHAGKFSDAVANSLRHANYEIIAQIIWAKQHFVISRGDYHWQHEPCWYGVRKGSNHNWQGARDQSTLWQISSNNPFGNSAPEEQTGHSTQKPIECMARAIRNNTKQGDVVCDPFIGSGTTLIAAEQLERIFYGSELEPAYVDQAVRRWQNLTGSTAKREDGRTFNELANANASA